MISWGITCLHYIYCNLHVNWNTYLVSVRTFSRKTRLILLGKHVRDMSRPAAWLTAQINNSLCFQKLIFVPNIKAQISLVIFYNDSHTRRIMSSCLNKHYNIIIHRIDMHSLIFPLELIRSGQMINVCVSEKCNHWFELWFLHWTADELKFNIYVRCDMAYIEPMHRNKSNITRLRESM